MFSVQTPRCSLRSVRAATDRQPRSGKRALVRARYAVDEPEQATVKVPQSIHDINNCSILGYGGDLAEGHPGFHDVEYKNRRTAISDIARDHKVYDPIPAIKYTAEEVETWATVLRQLRSSIPKWACKEYIKTYEALGFREDCPPQLQEMNEALQYATGWSIRPTAGLMHPRQFLNGLAFRTFHSTQYMRHHSNPIYTPEPDVIHELLGHVPMLLNSEYCELVEEIGKASLGASDKEIWILTKVYWYTIEFGVLREGEDIKAFGAGILSSFGELEWMGTGKAKIEPLDLTKPLPKMSYKDGYQQRYFCLDSFIDGAAMLTEFATGLEPSR